MNGKTYELALVSGVEGPCVSLNNYRIAGPKPWGGGQVTRSWQVTDQDLLNAVPELLAEERDRVRRDLETVAQEWAKSKETASLHNPGEVFASDLRAALDRICPAHDTTSPSTTSS